MSLLSSSLEAPKERPRRAIVFRFFQITVAVMLLAALAPTSHANAIRFNYLGDAPSIDGALAPAVGDTLTFDVTFRFRRCHDRRGV